MKNHRTLKPEIKASDKNILYRYDQRAIPYLESPFVRHTGTFNNEVYFDIIDAVRNGSIEDLNKIMLQNGNEPLSQVEFDDFIQSYLDFQDKVKNAIGNVDATYGIKGTAAPWKSSSTGEILMNGGAEQIVTPLTLIYYIELELYPNTRRSKNDKRRIFRKN